MRSSVNVSTPESVPVALARLNAVIDDVAKQPGWNYERIAAEAGFHVMTLHSLRKGRTRNPDERTLRGLDLVLGYEPGKGVQRILDGKRPVPARKPEEEETDPNIAEIEATGLNREQKDILIAVYRNQIAAAAAGVREQAREWEEQRRQGA